MEKFYAKGIYCENEDCNDICVVCSNASYIFDLGKVKEANRITSPLYLDEKNPYDIKVFSQLNYIKKEVFSWVKEGNGLYLYSKTSGNGKTTWANKLMLQFVFDYAKLMGQKKIVELNYPVVKWANVPEMFDELRREFDGRDYDASLRQHLLESRLVVFDDLGAEKSSEWVISQLYLYINSRLENKKSTIITSNYSLEDLLKGGFINQRIYSRLKTFTRLEFTGPDRRGLK